MNENAQDAGQRAWAGCLMTRRTRVLAGARRHMAQEADAFVQVMRRDLGKSAADGLTAEVLPLLAAMRYLEKNAARVLAPKRLGLRGLPFWLTGIASEVHRVPFGEILVIGASNYPLMLAGIQAAQALVAGNAVVWKPGRGGRGVALLFAEAFEKAGLPAGLLRVTEDTVEAAQKEIAAGVDKVVFTGSAPSGRAILRQLAETLTPAVMELSGCDPVIVLPGANLERAVRALVFGLRLNQSQTCMAPRRVMLVGASAERKALFVSELKKALKTVAAVPVPVAIVERLEVLLREAEASGAEICRKLDGDGVSPVLVLGGRPEMGIAQEDIFAPVLTLMEVNDFVGVLAGQKACPFGLSAGIFGPEKECRELAAMLDVGTVFINDVIVPTADPRLPFGGRRRSGFGVTQGEEGLLEMTAVKTIAVRRLHSKWQYDEMTDAHADFFADFIRATYGGRGGRLSAVMAMMRSGRKLPR